MKGGEGRGVRRCVHAKKHKHAKKKGRSETTREGEGEGRIMRVGATSQKQTNKQTANSNNYNTTVIQ